MKLSFVVLVVLSGLGPVGADCSLAWGQAKAAGVAAKPDDRYAAEPLVVVRRDEVYRMQADGLGEKETTVVARVQSESTLKQISVLGVPFAAKSQRVDWIYARVRHADGTVTETPVDGAIEVADQVTREAPFYSDLKQIQLPLRDLRLGDTLEWKAKVVQTAAEAPNQFWSAETFTRDAVVLEQSLELHLPKTKYVNVWSPKFKPVESSDGDQHVYRWTWEQLKPTVGPEADAAKEAEKKRVKTADEELDEREGKLPDVAWTTFRSWEEVGDWYRGLELERTVPDADVKAKVAQLTAGKTTEQEKVQAVYRYVATEIHYIGVAFGVGRYQPHSAGDVLANQYGDCKDKHTLLAAMLQVLGLHPDAVLIGAGIRFNEAVPSPGSFNHLITRVDVDGKPVWLDTTAEVAPYGMLIYVTRDESALVIPASGVAKIEKTPANAPFEQVNRMEATGTLDSDGVSKSKITLTFRGDTEVQFRAVLRQVSPAQYDQLAQNIAGSMGYAGTANHLDVSRPEDTSGPLTMSFDYKRVKGGDWANYRAIPQLAPVPLPQVDDKEPVVESLALGVPRVESSSAAMKLPEGWGVELPEAIHAKSPWATYDLTYRFENGTMYAQRKVEILAERVPVADIKAYEKFAKDADIANEQYVQLTRVKVSTVGTGSTGAVTIDGPPAAGENNAEAAKLVNRAEEAMKSSDLVTTGSLLDQAKALNANQRGLWSLYGYVCFRKGDLPGAVKDYQKEIELHPMATNVYPYLVQAQVALNQNEAAEKTLRQWAQADPSAAQATLQLGSMLIDDGKPAEAAKATEEALAAAPSGEKPNEALELMLGRAQLRAGMKDKGHETLLSLVKSTDNPDMMNDAAYELADAGLELPLAEQTTRAALDKMEQQSLTWTLDENEQTLRSKTRMLQATWDTMGWVYFREGNLAKAEQYVKASWLGRQDAEVGKHMGEIEAAKGNKNAALLDYQMALATVPGYDMLGVHKERRTPVEVDLAARIEALRKSGAQAGATDAKQALRKLRFIPLGPASGLNGTAEYKLLVSGGAVGRIEPTGDKTLAGGIDRLKKASLSALVPAGSPAQLVLGAMLNCHSNVCELVVEQ